MGNTRFVVVKAKEVIKTAVFAVLGVIIIVGLITFFLHMGNDEDTGLYRDGTYYGEMQVGENATEIAVEIKNGEIAAVSVEEMTEAAAVFYPLLGDVAEEIGKEVVKSQSLTVEVEPEQAYSAQLVLDAIAACLEEAK